MSWPFLVLLSSVSIISTFSATSKQRTKYILFHSRSAVCIGCFRSHQIHLEAHQNPGQNQNMSLRILHIHFQKSVLMTCFTSEANIFCVAQSWSTIRSPTGMGIPLLTNLSKSEFFFVLCRYLSHTH